MYIIIGADFIDHHTSKKKRRPTDKSCEVDLRFYFSSEESVGIPKKSLSLQMNSACGEIGRRARLRIWCFTTCRFESYQAHEEILTA